MKKYKVILNPVAGHGNGLKARPAIERLLAGHRLDYDLVQTECAGHALELTRRAAAEGYAVIVAAGGDGTVNEVINGLMEVKQAGSPPPALGILCTGRGNDLAYSLGIPVELDAACQVSWMTGVAGSTWAVYPAALIHMARRSLCAALSRRGAILVTASASASMPLARSRLPNCRAGAVLPVFWWPSYAPSSFTTTPHWRRLNLTGRLSLSAR